MFARLLSIATEAKFIEAISTIPKNILQIVLVVLILILLTILMVMIAIDKGRIVIRRADDSDEEEEENDETYGYCFAEDEELERLAARLYECTQEYLASKAKDCEDGEPRPLTEDELLEYDKLMTHIDKLDVTKETKDDIIDSVESLLYKILAREKQIENIKKKHTDDN